MPRLHSFLSFLLDKTAIGAVSACLCLMACGPAEGVPGTKGLGEAGSTGGVSGPATAGSNSGGLAGHSGEGGSVASPGGSGGFNVTGATAMSKLVAGALNAGTTPVTSITEFLR